jgi:hypothetical protein
MMDRYSIIRFVARVKDGSLEEITSEADRECALADAASRKGRHAKNKAQTESQRYHAGLYARDLRGLLFFIDHGIKPPGVPAETFLEFRPIFENLVSRNQMSPNILNAFVIWS